VTSPAINRICTKLHCLKLLSILFVHGPMWHVADSVTSVSFGCVNLPLMCITAKPGGEMLTSGYWNLAMAASNIAPSDECKSVEIAVFIYGTIMGDILYCPLLAIGGLESHSWYSVPWAQESSSKIGPQSVQSLLRGAGEWQTHHSTKTPLAAVGISCIRCGHCVTTVGLAANIINSTKFYHKMNSTMK